MLFISDGLKGVNEAIHRQFPKAEYQLCWVHISRNISKRVRATDHANVLDDLKKVYRANDAEMELNSFLEKYKKTYPRLRNVFENAASSLFSFYKFSEKIRRNLYTTNLIERSNKELKRSVRVEEQFPNEWSLERFVCCFYSDINRKYSGKTLRGFQAISSELEEMFRKVYADRSTDEEPETVCIENMQVETEDRNSTEMKKAI